MLKRIHLLIVVLYNTLCNMVKTLNKTCIVFLMWPIYNREKKIVSVHLILLIYQICGNLFYLYQVQQVTDWLYSLCDTVLILRTAREINWRHFIYLLWVNACACISAVFHSKAQKCDVHTFTLCTFFWTMLRNITKTTNS